MLATYLSGKLCPLTPSQRPTNVEHLVVNTAPSSSNNLNLKGAKNLQTNNVTENKELDGLSDDSKLHKDSCNEESSVQNQKIDQNMDSSGYCSIM